MGRKFIRALVVVLATVAVLGFAYPDDLLDDDASSQGEMAIESPVTLPRSLVRQPIDSVLLAGLSDSTNAPSSVVSTAFPAPAPLSSPVLRC